MANYAIGAIIYDNTSKILRKWLVGIAVFINLFILGYFKYAYFFTDSFNRIFNTNYKVVNYLLLWSNRFFDTTFSIDKIILPVGISFFTFQAISYIVDIYRNDVKPCNNILDFGFFLSFFPQLVAGPIVRASEFIPQLYQPFHLSRLEFGTATYMILKGLFKKLFIADYIAVNFIDRIFASPESYTGFENLFAIISYSIQIYCDFSGYTDIAIGLALYMGFRLPKNFNSPYKAKNVAEFWKRWHMTLSNWLKDYLYIPIGGNKKGNFRTNINLMITMLLGGLWHGASWLFVIWGGLNGLALLVYKNWKRISPYEKRNSIAINVWKVLFTFLFISFTRIFFRSDTLEGAWAMILQITTSFDFSVIPDVMVSYHKIFMVVAIGFITHWLPDEWKEGLIIKFSSAPYVVQAIIAVVTVFVIYQSVSAEMQPFVYFQF
jgi:D-alanyl-lipoteichoic acid acyltransferase DltB (MBOAT superfamily)